MSVRTRLLPPRSVSSRTLDSWAICASGSVKTNGGRVGSCCCARRTTARSRIRVSQSRTVGVSSPDTNTSPPTSDPVRHSSEALTGDRLGRGVVLSQGMRDQAPRLRVCPGLARGRGVAAPPDFLLQSQNPPRPRGGLRRSRRRGRARWREAATALSSLCSVCATGYPRCSWEVQCCCLPWRGLRVLSVEAQRMEPAHVGFL